MKWALFIFHRWWRLTPVYMVTMGIWAALTVHFGVAIYKEAFFDNYVRPLCDRYWWTQLLYINNLYPFKGSLDQTVRISSVESHKGVKVSRSERDLDGRLRNIVAAAILRTLRDPRTLPLCSSAALWSMSIPYACNVFTPQLSPFREIAADAQDYPSDFNYFIIWVSSLTE